MIDDGIVVGMAVGIGASAATLKGERTIVSGSAGRPGEEIVVDVGVGYAALNINPSCNIDARVPIKDVVVHGDPGDVLAPRHARIQAPNMDSVMVVNIG